MKFRIGDVVKKKSGCAFNNGQKTAKVIEVPSLFVDSSWAVDPRKTWIDPSEGCWILSSDIELVQEANTVKYEDKWTLFETGMTVPDGADVSLSQAGHVVAFRPIKKPEVKEVVRYFGNKAQQGWSSVQNELHKHKVTLQYTDGVLTDVRLEK